MFNPNMLCWSRYICQPEMHKHTPIFTQAHTHTINITSVCVLNKGQIKLVFVSLSKYFKDNCLPVYSDELVKKLEHDHR